MQKKYEEKKFKTYSTYGFHFVRMSPSACQRCPPTSLNTPPSVLKVRSLSDSEYIICGVTVFFDLVSYQDLV